MRTADILELTKSRSYYLAASEAARAKVLGNLDWYLHEHLGHGPRRGSPASLSDAELAGCPGLTPAVRCTRPGTVRRVALPRPCTLAYSFGMPNNCL